jgi:N-formylmaleamate deformylase
MSTGEPQRISPQGRSGFAAANGLRHHYLEYGSKGPPVVVVPGITSPAITWEFVSKQLAADYRVYTIDVRGRGLSDRAEDGGYRLPDYAADVAGLIEAIGLDRPIVLGHSMGARIAAALGALYPSSHGPLIAVDPPLAGPGRDPYPFPLQIYVDQLHEAYAGATADDMRRYFPTWSDRELQIRAEWLPTCDETAVVETYENFHTEDFFDYWPRVAPPVLFMYGLDSPVVPASALEEVRSTNPSAEVVGIAAAGHMIPWDNLVDFVDGVHAFVRREG